MQGKAFCKTWHNIALDISIFCAVKNIQTTQVNFVVSLYNIQTPADKDKQTCISLAKFVSEWLLWYICIYRAALLPSWKVKLFSTNSIQIYKLSNKSWTFNYWVSCFHMIDVTTYPYTTLHNNLSINKCS